MSGPRPVSPPSAAPAHPSVPSTRPHRARPAPGLVSGLVFPPVPTRLDEPGEEAATLVADFVHALLAAEDDVSCQFVQRLLDGGMAPQALYEECFAPAARVLGRMWETDDCSFYEVTVGTGRIQRMVRDLSNRFLAEQAFPGSAGRILLGCASGEQHSLGVAILAEYFVRDGWDVHLASGVGSDGLLDKVRESEYNLLGFSVSGSERTTSLRREIQLVRQVSRNRDIRILVGGHIISADPALVRRLGADGSAADATSAVREARRLMGHS